MLNVIDADTHIAEPAAMWDMIDEPMRGRRPVLLSLPDDTLYGAWNATWLIDGSIYPKPAGKGGFRLITPAAAKVQANRKDSKVACREMSDIDARMADMDRLGIAKQVVYPTLFLIYLTSDPELDVALARAYNRYIAQACAKSNGRIHWAAVPPLRCIEEAVKELAWCKQNGAVGVFFRGMEGDDTLDNPRFLPVFEKAQELDLAICIHTGSSTPGFLAKFDLERNRQWSSSAFPPLHAFRDLIINRIPETFPKLRFAFLEASASWVPYLLHKLKRDNAKRWKPSWKSGVDLFAEYRMYIACEADEDLSYLVQHIGADHILSGSDYGHNDPAEQSQLVAQMKARDDLDPALIEQILCKNPKEFYRI